MTSQIEKDSDGKDITEFKCKNCNKSDLCRDGRYVCS
jgi:hypothetical protein